MGSSQREQKEPVPACFPLKNNLALIGKKLR